MQNPHIIAALIMVAGLTGCAPGWPHSHPVDYANLPGTRDTAKGPGLLSGDHYNSANGGGTLLYSSDKPNKAVFGSIDSHRATSSSASGSDKSANSSTGAPPAANSSGKDFSDFREFEAYRQFQQLPADSPEKQRFKAWQQWQEYQRWERQQQSSQ